MSETKEKFIVRSLRELDRLVAEHLFDWSDFWEWNGDGATDALGHQVNSGLVMGYSPEERSMGIDGERSEVWHYSTDIAAAWAIVERLTPKEDFDANDWWQFDLNREMGRSYAEFTHIEIYNVAPEHQGVLGLTDTRSTCCHQANHANVCIAICLAALKTVGVDVKLETNPATEPTPKKH